MAEKLLVVILAGPTDSERARQGLVFAKNARKMGLLDEVEVLFFGPGVQFLSDEYDPEGEFKRLVQENYELGSPVSACVSNLRRYSLQEEVKEHNVLPEEAAFLISDAVKDGYEVVTF